MTKVKSNFRGKITKDAQRQQKAATSYGHLLLPRNVNVFSPEPGGKVQLDFLPYEVTDHRHPDQDKEAEIATPGTLWYKRPYKLHRSVGTDNDSYVCLTSIGKKCPICEYRSKRMKEGADKEETDAMRASLRNLYIVVPLDSKKHELTPHIFDISQFLFQNLLNEELEENEDNGVFPELVGGKTLKVRFESRTIGKGQPFAEASRIDFIDREEDYDESILDEVPDLDNVLKVLTYEELNMKFFDLSDEEDGGKLSPPDDEEEEEDEKPIITPLRRHKTLTHHAPVVKEEDEEKPFKHKRNGEIDTPARGSTTGPVRTAKEREEDAPVRTTTRRARNVETEDDPKNKCPHGHKFGVDTDKFDDCDTCALWDSCTEAKEKK